MDVERLEADMLGYIKYKRRVFDASYGTTALKSIQDHRDSIVRKYSSTTDKHVENILGTCMADGLFIPVDFDGTFIDADDVFAAVYSYDIDFTIRKGPRDKFVLWVLFTNDPYIPVLPMVCIQTVSVGELLLRKKRNDFIPEIQKRCSKLKYPITDLKEFEKTVNGEHTIRGSKVEKEFILQQIYDAKFRIGLFEPMSISYELGGMSRQILKENGFEVDDLGL